MKDLILCILMEIFLRLHVLLDHFFLVYLVLLDYFFAH